ncbi:unnamed protein product [Paramecium octaurelia]|uniref:Uncharacterized protein n=1 Tax=Paramecium octaurelia TaxID=43137 RepID=A0A8S1XCN9_PAROT|nr:unnamed protein product [Paramecium octaurelia]
MKRWVAYSTGMLKKNSQVQETVAIVNIIAQIQQQLQDTMLASEINMCYSIQGRRSLLITTYSQGDQDGEKSHLKDHGSKVKAILLILYQLGIACYSCYKEHNSQNIVQRFDQHYKSNLCVLLTE